MQQKDFILPGSTCRRRPAGGGNKLLQALQKLICLSIRQMEQFIFNPQNVN